MATTPEPIFDVIERVRRYSDRCPHCQGRFHCPYHEGWHDAFDILEDEIDG